MTMSPFSVLLPPQPHTPHVGPNTTGFFGGLAHPWSGSTTASMKSGKRRRQKTTVPQMEPAYASTVMHLREVRAAKLSFPQYLTMIFRSHLNFLHLMKNLYRGVFPVWHGEPWEKKAHYSHLAALAHGGYRRKTGGSLVQPSKTQRSAAQGLPVPQAASAAAAVTALHRLLSH